MIGDDGNRIRQNNDLPHSIDCQRLAVIYMRDLAAEYRTADDASELHARNDRVNPEYRAAVDLADNVQPLR